MVDLASLSDAELLELRARKVNEASVYNNQQLVRKVNLNSAYGALGSNYFRFYDLRLAEAVTTTGQYVIRYVADAVNRFLNQMLGTQNYDFGIASDTDSVYLRLHPVVERYLQVKPHATRNDIVSMLDAFAKKQIQPVINRAFQEIAERMRVHTPCLAMAREVIADRGIWTAKKRYILNVLNSEGVQYETPKLKIMGIEAVKSSTPAICREMIKECMRIFMNGTQEQLWAYIDASRSRFRQASFEEVAFPRSVNGLEKYARVEKGVPIHVAGALVYNRTLREQKLDTVYETIKEGEKIRFVYLTAANPFHSHVLSAPERCPVEWNIEQWIDYAKQFEKSFLEPLSVILACGDWSIEPTASLF